MLVALTGTTPGKLSSGRRKWTFEQLGEAAARLNLPLFVVSPSSVHMTSRHVSATGELYQEHDGRFVWRKRHIILPQSSIVYDAMYLSDLKRFPRSYKRLLRELSERGIPAFNPIMPGKDVVYHALERAPLEVGTLPKTKYRLTPSRVLNLYNHHSEWWLKPIYGSGGRNILFVRKVTDGKYHVVGQRFFGGSLNREVHEFEFRQLLRYAMRRRRYMAQRHVPLISSKDGRKVDFRVTVQRNHRGVWETTAVTARLGAKGAVLTNYHAGGAVRSLTTPTQQDHVWMEQNGIRNVQISQAKEFALSVAKALEKRFPLLGSLGVDLGLSQDGAWYVYDCNGRPGRDILNDKEVAVFMRSVAGFAHYLMNRRRAGSL